MSFIIDLIFLLIIVVSVISGIRKGFIHSVMSIITFFAAFICGWQFYPILGAYYNERIFMSRITNEVYIAISSLVHSTFDALFSDMPDALIELTDRFNVDISSVESYYSSQATASASELTKNISSYIAEPISTEISNILAFITIFFGVIIILKIVTLILDLIFKLPVLNTLNRIFGFAFGVINGVLYIVVLSTVLLLLSPILQSLMPELYLPNMIDNSMIIAFINKLNIAPK